MGMRAPIIHGMHTVAVSCAALENHSTRHARRIDCRFRAPVTLGNAVALRVDMATGEFVVEAAGARAVTGGCTLAAQGSQAEQVGAKTSYNMPSW